MSSAVVLVLVNLVALAEPNSAPALEVRDCRIKYIDQVMLASERTGVIAQLNVVEGDRVSKEQLLVKLRDEVAQAHRDVIAKQAESDVKIRSSKKNREVADAEHRSIVEANNKLANAIGRIEELKLRLKAELAVLEIEYATFELDIAKIKAQEADAELKTYALRPPFDGTIVRVFKQPGEAVQQGEHILEVVNPKRLRIEGYVDVIHANRLRPGQSVVAEEDHHSAADSIDEKKGKCEGKIVFIDPAVEPISRKVRIWAEVQNPNLTLRAGGVARLIISTENNHDKTAKDSGKTPAIR